MGEFELISFRLENAAVVATWFLDADDVARCTGERRYPLYGDDVIVWSYEASRSFLLLANGQPIAYGELIEDDADSDLEIGHVVIAPSWRKRGAAGMLIEGLIAAASQHFPYGEIWLRISRANEDEIAQSVASGFTESPDKSGQNFIWLRRNL